MNGFLPTNKKEMNERGWEQADFVLVTGDAYVDHPSFGHAIISRILESHGYRVGIIAQPDWKDEKSITILGRPRLGFLVSGGNIDYDKAAEIFLRELRSGKLGQVSVERPVDWEMDEPIGKPLSLSE